MRFRTDPKVETEGAWLMMDHAHIKLARAGENNRAFKELMSSEFKKIETAFRVGMVGDEKSMAIIRKAYAEAVVKDWESPNEKGEFVKGVELMKDGAFVIVPGSPETYLEYISDPANSDTFRAMREFAQSGAAYVEMRATEAGN